MFFDSNRFFSLLLALSSFSATPVNADTTFEEFGFYLLEAGNSQTLDFSESDYWKATRALKTQFETVCADSFCEGQFGNLTSMDFSCSIRSDSGRVRQCVWTFAGSFNEVDPQSGEIATRYKVFSCDLGFNGDVRNLSEFLVKASTFGSNGYVGLRNTIVPGGSLTLMEVIGRCIDARIR